MRGDADILLVDDDDDLRELLAELLQQHGFSVVEASNGEAALAFLTGSPAPRLILLDLMMQVMNGYGFLEERKHRPELATVPIFLFTARDGMEDQAATLGVNRVFRKPLDIPGLLAAVTDVVKR